MLASGRGGGFNVCELNPHTKTKQNIISRGKTDPSFDGGDQAQVRFVSLNQSKAQKNEEETGKDQKATPLRTLRPACFKPVSLRKRSIFNVFLTALRFEGDKSNFVIHPSIYARGVDSWPAANAALLRLSITDFDSFNLCVSSTDCCISPAAFFSTSHRRKLM